MADEEIDTVLVEEVVVEKQRQFAYRTLVVFSGLLLTIPFLAMYIFNSILRDTYHFSNSDSMTYSGVLAIVAVYLIVGAFAYTAYCEDNQLKQANTQKKVK